MVDGAACIGSNSGLTLGTCGQVAQSVEQGTENPRVGSSILSLATIVINDLAVFPPQRLFCACVIFA